MNTQAALDAFRNLLPPALAPYPLFVLLVGGTVLTFICWKAIRLVMRIGWTIRMLLFLASLFAYSGVRGCPGAQSAGKRIFGACIQASSNLR